MAWDRFCDFIPGFGNEMTSAQDHCTDASLPPQTLWWTAWNALHTNSERPHKPLPLSSVLSLLLLTLPLPLSLSPWRCFQGELIYDPVFLCVNDRQTQQEIIIWGRYYWIAVGGQGSQKVVLQPQTEKTSGESHTNLTASFLVFFHTSQPALTKNHLAQLSASQARLHIPLLMTSHN